MGGGGKKKKKLRIEYAARAGQGPARKEEELGREPSNDPSQTKRGGGWAVTYPCREA